jgi:hypothetical protein
MTIDGLQVCLDVMHIWVCYTDVGIERRIRNLTLGKGFEGRM